MDRKQWLQQALDFARDYLAGKSAGSTFQVHELRAWAHDNGCPIPPSQRVWGSVIRSLRAQGRVKYSGIAWHNYQDKHSSHTSERGIHSVWSVL